MRRLAVAIFFGLVLPVAASAQTTYVLREQTSDESVTVRTVTADQYGRLSAAQKRLAGPNRRYRALYTPNDPSYALQWDFAVTNVPGAWDAGTTTPFFGDLRVVVAVLDTGVAYAAGSGTIQSPDLVALHTWTNPNETIDGVDNDGNGYVDDVHGWNFVGNNAQPLDDYGHGTHIASIIAADTNNGVGAAGIAPNVTIMPLKVLDEDGNGTTATITKAIAYAVAHGANIINLSLGGTLPDEVLHAAIQDAAAKGVLVVAATGNEGASSLNYPARYAETLSVGASQYDGTRAPYSNYGSGLNVVAPGGNIELDQNNDQYKDGIPQETCAYQDCRTFGVWFYSGTSQAAAHVSGIAALLDSCVYQLGRSPSTELATIREAIISTAHDSLAAGWDTQTGNGTINAQAALSALGCNSVTPESPSSLIMSARSDAIGLTSNRSFPYTKPLFSWSGPSGATYHVSWGLAGKSPATKDQSATTFQPTITKSGTYVLSVTSVTAEGHESPAVVRMYRYQPAQITMTDRKRLTILSNRGAVVRNVTLASSPTVPVATGTTLTATGDQGFLVGRAGAVDVYQTNGIRSRTLRPFGKSATKDIAVAIERLANQDSLYVVAAAQGGDVRLVTATGTLFKRLTTPKAARGYTVGTGDLDGDAQDEIILADAAGAAIRIYSANGTFVTAATPTGKKYTGGWSMAVGDVTGDGQADIVAIRRTDRKTITAFILNASGQTIKTFKLRGLKATSASQVTTADIDGNGRDEIIVFAPGKAELTVWNDRGGRTKIMAVAGSSTDRRLGRIQ